MFYLARTREDTFKNILKIGAWPNAYKKKVDDVRVIAILESLLSFKFDTFENAEFIFSLM